MRFLRPCYLDISSPGNVISKESFLKVFKAIQLEDDDFNSRRFVPGSSGESELYATLMNESGINK